MREAQKKMRITFVIPYFYPAWEYGGQPRAAYELARALARRGHRIKVLTTDSGGKSRLPEAGARDVEGIKVIYYRNLSNRLAYKYRLFWPSEMFRSVAVEIAESDVVHIHELRSTTSVLAYRAARRAGIPYVLSGHGGLRRLGRALLKTVYDAIWGQRILHQAATVIVVSPREAADAKAMGVRADRIQLLPNIVRSDDFKTLPAAAAFRQRRSTPDGQMVLFLGRLHPLKGADLLVQAFSMLSSEFPQAFLVVAGPDDGQESEIRRTISKLNIDSRVRVVGFLDLEAKKEAFVGSSVFVVPSRSEVFAITAVEALMCGTPVLLSSACGLDPLPEPKESVNFFNAEDVGDLAKQLRHILQNEEVFRRAARTAQLSVFQLFSPEKIGDQAELLYDSVLSRPVF